LEGGNIGFLEEDWHNIALISELVMSHSSTRQEKKVLITLLDSVHAQTSWHNQTTTTGD
jgi:hypothetical protein